jgi:hypothetical protein
MRHVVFFKFADETDMQVAPLAHHFLLIVAVVPAVQSMVGRAFLLHFCRLDYICLTVGTEVLFEGIKHTRDVIVKLRGRERVCVSKQGSCFTAARHISRILSRRLFR